MSASLTRRLYLDLSPGEARGVVVLNGAAERLLIARGDEGAVRPGATLIARVRRIERGLASAFLDLGEGPDAILPLGPVKLAEGAAVEVEIAAPARRGKGPLARLIGPSEGPPRLIRPAPDLKARLQAFAPGVTITEGGAARQAADVAEDAALAIEHPLGGGASVAVEATRALIAVDVDVGGAAGGDRRRGEARVNRLAIEAAARLIRLKGLGGLVVFDLAGRGQDGEALSAAAKDAFGPDMPGVAFGPVSRFGTLQLTLPWRERPVSEVLNDPDGRPAVSTMACRLARAVEAAARRETRVRAICASDVAEALEALRPAMVERLGPRVDIEVDPAFERSSFEVRAHG